MVPGSPSVFFVRQFRHILRGVGKAIVRRLSRLLAVPVLEKMQLTEVVAVLGHNWLEKSSPWSEAG